MLNLKEAHDKLNLITLVISTCVSTLVRRHTTHQQTYLLPLSAVCTIEVIQLLSDPQLLKHSSVAAILHLIKLPEALILSLCDNKERNHDK